MILTPGQLKAGLATGQTPDGDFFSNLIDSLRHISASIPANQVSGINALIDAAIAARTEANERKDLSFSTTASLLRILITGGNPVDLPFATTSNPGILSIELFRKLADMEAGATADQTKEEIIQLISQAVGDARLSATVLRDLDDIIDNRIVAAGGGGGGGGGGINTPIARTIAGSGTYTAPAETRVSGFLVFPTSTGTLKIGTSPNTGDIFEATVSSTEALDIETSNFSLNQRTLYFTGSFNVRFIVTNYATA